MNLHIGSKRSSSDDINERRKRRRTISNDLNRGLVLNEREPELAQSESDTDLSSMSSENDDTVSTKSTQTTSKTTNGASSSSHCSRRSNCKCDEVPKLLKVQTELLSLLTDIRKKNADIHKSVMLEMQICRQEIIEEVQQLKERISRMIELTRRTNYNQENFAFLEIADPDENGDDDSPSELSSDDEDVHERHDLFR